MPEDLHPGVFVEETTFRSKSIEGVSTTTTGFVGPCRWGPITAPANVITSLVEFERTYGGGAKLKFAKADGQPGAARPMDNYLWHAARAFFTEGGKRLYIARVFRPLKGDYPPDFSKPENLAADAAPAKMLWADGHARATFSGTEFRSRFPGAASNFIVRVTVSAGAPDSPTVSINVLSKDRRHDFGTWSNLSLDPVLDQPGGRDSIFQVFCETPQGIGETSSVPLVIGSGTKNTLARKLAAGVTKEFSLVGGNDGIRPGEREYEGTEDANRTFKTGLKQFHDVDDISIVAAPGSTADYKHYHDAADSIYEHLIRHANLMRYRIAILDSPPVQSIADVRKVRAKLDSTYAAFYYPWITVLDPLTRRALKLPPSGFVAGIYARTDVNRGVFKAPANEVVNLAIGLEFLLSKSQQEVLNPEGINCFRFFEGRGFRLWGARTISSDPEWKYVNIRRYLAYLEHSIDKGTQWAVFEPNGPPLWMNVRRTVEDFLLNEFRIGALLGAKPEQAFFVKCDRSTITQDDLNNGRLVALIGVAALRPAEFVIFRIGQWTADRKS
jgi:phage tail sheath protein FI